MRNTFLRQPRIAARPKPVEATAVDDETGRAVFATDVARVRMDDDIAAVIERTAQRRRRNRVVDDERRLRALGDRGQRGDVGDLAAGGDGCDNDRLRLRTDG